MDALETLIRDTLTERAADAPPASSLAVSRHRRWPYVVLAAASVVGLAVGLSFALPGDGPPPTSPAASGAASPDVHRPAPGTKTIAYHGMTIDVPSRLPVASVICGRPSNEVVTLDPTFVAKCPPGSAFDGYSKGTVVFLSVPRRAPDFGDPGAGITTNPLVVSVVPAEVGTVSVTLSSFRSSVTGTARVRGVTVTVLASSKANVLARFRTIRQIDTDALGCRAFVSEEVPPQPAADSLVPGHPVSARLCDYVHDGDSRWELGSSTIPAAKVAPLVAALDALPAGSAQKLGGDQPRWVVFTYADGSRRTVVVQRYYYPSPVTDGHRTLVDAHGAFARIVEGF